jgi:hypothetical protein
MCSNAVFNQELLVGTLVSEKRAAMNAAARRGVTINYVSTLNVSSFCRSKLA